MKKKFAITCASCGMDIPVGTSCPNGCKINRIAICANPECLKTTYTDQVNLFTEQFGWCPECMALQMNQLRQQLRDKAYELRSEGDFTDRRTAQKFMEHHKSLFNKN